MIRLPRDATRRTTHGCGIPAALIDTHGPMLGATGVAVYVALARYADPETGACMLDSAQIARVLGLTPATVDDGAAAPRHGRRDYDRGARG